MVILAIKNTSITTRMKLKLIMLCIDTNQQEITNHRLAVLTILPAVFMLLTLLAGIYIMNLENIPELHFTWGYPGVIIGMFLIAVCMYLYFKISGWLD